MILPAPRNTDILVQPTSQEVLIYDLETNKAYCLNETSVNIFNACSEQRSFSYLRDKYNYSDDLIFLALDELKKYNLIEENYQSKFNTIDRRNAIKKIGLSTMVAIPIITSIVAPQAIQAASCEPDGTQVSTTLVNQSGSTSTNQNAIGALLAARCCSNTYQNFISDGCSNGIGQICSAQATCSSN